MVKKMKNCIGTTQTNPFNKVQNFGGFTDGDRGVFLASYFKAKKLFYLVWILEIKLVNFLIQKIR
jgi:Uncharacterized Rossmann fold enzyme